MPMEKTQIFQAPEEDQAWKGEVRQKLKDGHFIAVEGNGVLLASDVLTAINVVNTLEADRDETEEWNHIKKLQHERAERFAGSAPN